jgi:hypothetical protein
VAAKPAKENDMNDAMIKQAMQEAADAKMREKTEKAYNAASRTPPRQMPAKKMAKGGGVTRADGCVTKGHTKGTMVKMAMGGKAC